MHNDEHRALAAATEQRRVDALERAVADIVGEKEARELVDIIEAERGDFETRFSPRTASGSKSRRSTCPASRTRIDRIAIRSHRTVTVSWFVGP